MSVILFIIILVVLILVHELGHFLAAKISGARVDEFAIGFPPSLLKKKIGETVYSINLIPFGGYVKIFGEDGEEGTEEESDKEQSLINKSKQVQAAVLSAGVLFNLMLGWFLISSALFLGMPVSQSALPQTAVLEKPRLVIVEIFAKSPAEEAGLTVGDVILSLQSHSAKIDNPTVEEVQQFINQYGDDEILMQMERKGIKREKEIKPVEGLVEGKLAIGMGMDRIGIWKLPVYFAFTKGAVMTAKLSWETAKSLGKFLASIFIGRANLSAVTGPVGLAGLVGAAGELGFIHLITLTAVISVNLALINLIPFPALDGGRLLFVFIEWLKGSPINKKVAGTLNLIGFMILIIFMLAVTYSDIARLFV